MYMLLLTCMYIKIWVLFFSPSVTPSFSRFTFKRMHLLNAQCIVSTFQERPIEEDVMEEEDVEVHVHTCAYKCSFSTYFY